ncbi:MAG TPA: beta-propeller fold lactonase family protein [Terriglobia bacterium]|nr:beta-propeller fold lactonase family protein [Terriglobia bacterium]
MIRQHIQSASRWLALAALIVTSGSVTPLRAQSVNAVYLESNIGSTSNMNSVFGFSNDGNGNLTPLPNSPYLTGGTGIYNPGASSTALDADREVILTPTNNNGAAYVLAVNGHSNTFTSFSVNSDGSLTQVSGTPVSSNGQDPASFGLAYELFTGGYSWLPVLNKNEDPLQNMGNKGATNVSVFKLNSFGKPQLVSVGTIDLTEGSSPSQILEVNDSLGHFAYLDTMLTTGTVTAYKIRMTGQLQLINSVNAPTTGASIQGMVFHPKYKVIYAGLPSLNEVGVFGYNSTNSGVSYVKAVSNPGKNVGWLAVDSSGGYLYTAESGSGTVTVYSLTHYLTPSEVQHYSLVQSSKGETPSAANLAFDPTGKFLYCLDSANSVLHVLTVDATTGQLSEPNAPTVLDVPLGEQALGLATGMVGR